MKFLNAIVRERENIITKGEIDMCRYLVELKQCNYKTGDNDFDESIALTSTFIKRCTSIDHALLLANTYKANNSIYAIRVYEIDNINIPDEILGYTRYLDWDHDGDTITIHVPDEFTEHTNWIDADMRGEMIKNSDLLYTNMQ